MLRQIKKKCAYKKLGHAGTLDPLAEGLLIVLTEKETKLASNFAGLDKEYETVARIGISTESGDLEGAIRQRKSVENLPEEKIKKALTELEGCHEIPAPIYSAIKVKGKALYKYAREGKMPPFIPLKKMCVLYVKFLSVECESDFCDIRYILKVKSGTYVRSINEMLGKILGYPSSSAQIKRLSIGKYSLKDALKVKDLKCAPPGGIEPPSRA